MIFRSLTIQQHMSPQCPTEINKAVLENFGEVLKFVSTFQAKQKILASLLSPKIKTKANLNRYKID